MQFDNMGVVGLADQDPHNSILIDMSSLQSELQ